MDFIIIGRYFKSYVGIDKKILSYGEWVRIFYNIPFQDLVKFYNAAKLYIHPALNEGFGLPVLEAIKCGCICVVSDIPVFRELFGNDCIYINPENNPDILWDLNNYPWPFDDNEFDMVYCSHCLEHLEDPKKALEEIWRVSKPNAKLVLIVPHFSSRLAWWDVEHKRAFSSGLLHSFTEEYKKLSSTYARFKVEKIKFRWSPPIKSGLATETTKKLNFLIRILDSIITPLANLNIDICERFWCYFVGGIGEIHFYARVIK
ncbi:MAG: glycosyltransferase [Endomicrobiia bacterium]